MGSKDRVLKFRGREVVLGEKTHIVGILNATPDSFSDGGLFPRIDDALRRIESMIQKGASFVDIGGESTRPNFDPVSEKEEASRVLPLIEAAKRQFPDIILSLDTTKSSVAKKALQAGVDIINDISGFQGDPDMALVVADAGAVCILMHNARIVPIVGGTIDSIFRFWEMSFVVAEKAGLNRGQIILDPGIGFETTRKQDLDILRNVARLRAFGFPVMIGASRKRVTGELLDLSTDQRLETTLATTVCAAQGGADFVRVHDVQENARAARMADLIYRPKNVN